MERDSRVVPEEGGTVYPASDDSELLLSTIRVDSGERFLEIGVGGGLVALHVALVADVVATDVNAAATRVAVRDSATSKKPIQVVRCDLMSAVRGPFDVVAFNPPYLEGDPTDDGDRAWAGGRGGSAVALRFLRDLPRVLAPGGRAYLLLGDHNEAARAFAEARFHVRVAASKRLFFERLDVLELRPRTEGDCREAGMLRRFAEHRAAIR